jgi:hypothetical protein
MNTFPEGSTVGFLYDLGIDIKNAPLIMICDRHCTFPVGTILRLTKDDHSDAPFFTDPDGTIAAVFLHRLALIDFNALTPPLQQAAIKARLKGFF